MTKFDSEMLKLHEFSLILNSTHNIEEILKQSASAISNILEADGCHILFMKNARNSMDLETAIHYGKPFPPDLDETQGISGNTFATGESILVEDTLTDPRVTEEMYEYIGHRSLVSAPIITKGEIIGAIVIYSMQPKKFSKRDGDYLRLLGNHLGLAVENARLLLELKRMSIIEPLTGVYSRGFAKDELARFMCNHPNKSICVIVLDVNDLKPINDTYGHIAGDQVLFTVAMALKKNTIPGHIVARYGGDEFLLILPDSSLQDAVTIGAEIENSLETVTLPGDFQPIKISVSWGVAGGKCQDFQGPDELIDLADKSMYNMKKSYKNEKHC